MMVALTTLKFIKGQATTVWRAAASRAILRVTLPQIVPAQLRGVAPAEHPALKLLTSGCSACLRELESSHAVCSCCRLCRPRYCPATAFLPRTRHRRTPHHASPQTLERSTNKPATTHPWSVQCAALIVGATFSVRALQDQAYANGVVWHIRVCAAMPTGVIVTAPTAQRRADVESRFRLMRLPRCPQLRHHLVHLFSTLSSQAGGTTPSLL